MHMKPLCRRLRRPQIAFVIMLLGVCAGAPTAFGETSGVALPETLQGYNLIFINIDALRADHLGCYGYKRNTSPFIDSLAKEGLLFEEARANSTFTRESVSVVPACSLVPAARWAGTLSVETALTRRTAFQRGLRNPLLSNTAVLAD